VRLVSPTGEPITAPQLRRRLFDVNGTPMFDALGDAISDPADNDGAMMIGPLPRGIVTVAVDMPLFAQTRLPDANIGDATKIVDGGIVAIQQPGAVLHVDVVDGKGVPVRNHEVYVDDARPRSPLVFRPVRTNLQGRATFDRLAGGRYRVWTSAVDPCVNVLLTASQVVLMSGSGTIDALLVAGGRARFRITSPLGPAIGTSVSAAPTEPPLPLPFPYRATSSGCRGVTDGDGRVTLTNFPPGPAHVDVRMPTSTYVRQIDVPSDGREMTVAIPEGLQPVRVVNALRNQPVAGAAITWTGSGARIEATTTASGDALLEGVGVAGGTLAVSAAGYQPAEAQLAEAPGLPQTVALTPLPSASTLRPRVIAASGEPLANAVVELTSSHPAAEPRVATTNANGVVTFSDVPAGSLQLMAIADGYVTSMMRIGEDRSRDAVFTMSRGYRVIASVELPAAGPLFVRVVDDRNASMESFLDGESDRRIEPPGRLSVGPLAPGAYVLELLGPDGRRTERIRIVDRDVVTTVR